MKWLHIRLCFLKDYENGLTCFYITNPSIPFFFSFSPLYSLVCWTEFVTVLAEKLVTLGENCILSCEANSEYVTATWEKDGNKLNCVEGKHKVKKFGAKCLLEISKLEDKDEGNYTITLSNSAGSASCSALIRVSKYIPFEIFTQLYYKKKGF